MSSFSRDTFKINELKHYSGVRLQQGVPLVDADWNEMEDIRKFELQDVLKWFVGNGVPKGNDGFRILPASTSASDDFQIKGGDGTVKGAGRCLVDGQEVMINENMNYKDQPLYKNVELVAEWGVDPLEPLLDLPPGTEKREDWVYLDVWEREVNAEEDEDLVNPAIGIETCVRIKREWVVRVTTGVTVPSPPPQGHVFYTLALLVRNQGESVIGEIEDRRRTTNVNFMDLMREIMDARGNRDNLGDRLDVSLSNEGNLNHKVVGENQLDDDLKNKIGRPVGWLRLTFLPKKYRNQAEFTNDTTHAYCETVAQGNMEIPVPPGATTINNFRIYGNRNEGKIHVVIYGIFWDESSSVKELLRQEITDSSFNKTWLIDKSIEPETESISLFVMATDAAEISTVAFEFGFE